MKIKEREIELKYNLRSMLAFEQITGKRFSIDTLTDEFIYLYCIIISSNDIQLTFEEFIEALENDYTLLPSMRDYLNEQYKIQGQFNDDSEGKKKLQQ